MQSCLMSAIVIVVAACATNIALATVTGRPILKGISVVTLATMIVVALTRPMGVITAWVVIAVLGFYFAVYRRERPCPQK